jgi:hypothetical protein
MFGLYLLPWVVNPEASLTPNGYELAEWTSLHPVVRGGNPPLVPSLLLRLPLVCIPLVVAFSARQRSPLAALLVLVVSAGLLPPELLQASGNANSSQQGVLALVTLIGGMIGVSGILPKVRRWIATGAALVGAIASVLGLAQGVDLMRGFNLPAEIGLGGVALATAFALTAAASVYLITTKQTGQR